MYTFGISSQRTSETSAKKYFFIVDIFFQKNCSPKKTFKVSLKTFYDTRCNRESTSKEIQIYLKSMIHFLKFKCKNQYFLYILIGF